MNSRSRLTPANAVILVAGAVIVLGSFLAFYKTTGAAAILVYGHDQSWNAWSLSKDFLLFPISTIVVLFGAAMAAHVALSTFATVDLPDRPLGFTWDQVHLALGFHATVLMLAYLLRDKNVLSWGTGFWLMLFAAMALLIGAVLRTVEAAGSPRGR